MKNLLDYVLMLLAITVIILTSSLLWGAKKTTEDTGKGSISIEQAAMIFPDAAQLSFSAEEKEWTAVLDGSGNHLGSLIVSSPYTDHIMGYGGATPLLIGINPEGTIIEIILLKNFETPGFVKTVMETGFLKKLRGVHWKEAADLNVEAVSGATMTSNAIKETLRERLSIIDPASTPQQTASGVGFKWQDAGIILFPLAGLYLCLTKGKYHKKIRIFLLGFSILYLGFFTAATFSIALLDSWVLNGINLFGMTGIVVLSLAAIIIPIAFGKNVHCYFVCPFGAFQELLNKYIPWKMKIKSDTINKLSKIKYIILVIAALGLITGQGLNPNDLEPFSAFRPKAAGIAAIIIAVISLVAACGINRPWCSFGCAAGAFLELLKRPVSTKRQDPCSDTEK